MKHPHEPHTPRDWYDFCIANHPLHTTVDDQLRCVFDAVRSHTQRLPNPISLEDLLQHPEEH